MAVKKQFEEIYALLEANKNKQVKTLLPELFALMQSKSSGSDLNRTFLKDVEGNVTYVYCYYHKKWESVTIAEYGVKANTATGLNTMCKEGVSSWTRQQRAFKKQQSELLTKVANQELSPEELPALMSQLEEERKAIEVRCDEHGYATADDIPLE